MESNLDSRGRKISPTRERRMILGSIIFGARVLGLFLIALAILNFPQMHLVTRQLSATVGFISSLALGLAGTAVFIGVKLFVNFFDQYLSRN